MASYGPGSRQRREINSIVDEGENMGKIINFKDPQNGGMYYLKGSSYSFWRVVYLKQTLKEKIVLHACISFYSPFLGF